MSKQGSDKPLAAGRGKTAHVLFVVENNPVPADIRVWREAKAARDLGFEVSVISPRNETYAARRETLEGIEIHRHPVIRPRPGKLYQVLEYLNALLWETLLSLKVMLDRRFHILHAANPPDHLFVLGWLYRVFGVKFVFDHHDLAPELYVCKFGGRRGTLFKCLQMMEKASCRSADVVVTTNRSYRRHIIERHGIEPGKIFVVRNDPELNGGPPEKPAVPAEPGVHRLLYVGSINQQDGVELLVKAVDLLVNRLGRRNVRCTVLGDGDRLSQVKQLCGALDLARYFDFKGYIYDRRQVAEWIASADVCLETAPDTEVNRKSTFIKVMEYMAAGKALVAFDLEETRYTVGDAGLLVPPGDLLRFAEAIDELIGDPSRRAELGRRARQRIAARFNWQQAAAQLENAYARLVRG